MRFFALSDIGKVRRENQDAWREYSDPEKGECALVVCDGMGGANGGSTASALACESFMEHIRSCLSAPVRLAPDIMLHDAVSYANLRVFDRAFIQSQYRGMGTTLVAGLFLGTTATVINVGDSRAYGLSREGVLRQITEDHSFVAELLAKGKISPAQAKNHPKRNIITRALGMDSQIKSDVFHINTEEIHRLLLCTDGLTNQLSDGEIANLLLVHTTPEACCRALVDTALERGAPDNVTTVVIFMD